MATQPSAFGIAAPPPPTVPDIGKYIDIAKQQLDPGFSDVVTSVQNAGQQQAAGFQKLASDTLASQDIVEKTYGDLEKEFQVEQGIENKQAQQTGEARIGGAKAALAASGVTNAQGSFRAPVTGAENDLQSTISDIAAKYGAKYQDIADTLTANLQQIQQKADEYLVQGNSAMADTMTEVAKLKYSQQQQVTSLAQQMQSAETTYEQNTWKDYMDMVNAQHQQATLDLMAARLAQTASYESASLSLRAGAQAKTNLKDSLSSDVAAGIQSIADQVGSGKSAPFATEKLASQLATTYQKVYGSAAPSEEEIKNMLYAERQKSQYKDVTF